ncbi:MAG: diphosphomevalonate decarboxylase [Oligoflexales bacterium]
MSPKCRVRAPSNIALVKYWGKRDASTAWPTNSSLSMTLSTAFTETWAEPTKAREHEISFVRTNHATTSQAPSRAIKHLDFLSRECGFSTKLKISTRNSFPMASGIASSASGLCALTLAALGAWTHSSNLAELVKTFPIDKLARFTRMGSGSACRSLLGGLVQWHVGESSDDQRVEQITPAHHWDIFDQIMIFSNEHKTVSSSEGHLLAASSPMFAARVAGLKEKLALVTNAWRERNFSLLGPLIEQEALEMHAIMMTSTPPVNYIAPKAWEFLTWLREVRATHGIQAFFTLDAGTNVHVLGERKYLEVLTKLLRNDWEQNIFMLDEIGSGPTLDVCEEIDLG